MNLIKMSYKGFTFNVNPSTITMDYSKSINLRRFPFAASKAQEISMNPVKITGSGKFVGNGAREVAHHLERVFKSNGSAYLYVPDGTPIKAFFTALNVTYNSKEDSASYSFEFVEDYQDKSNTYDFGYTFALSGENLYDIANRTGIEIEKLVEHNDFCDLFSIKEGDKVWLC